MSTTELLMAQEISGIPLLQKNRNLLSEERGGVSVLHPSPSHFSHTQSMSHISTELAKSLDSAQRGKQEGH